MNQMMKDLCAEIALEFNTPASAVERCIRVAIGQAWLRGDVDYLNEIFQYMVPAEKGRPSNSQFIVTVVEYQNTKKEETLSG